MIRFARIRSIAFALALFSLASLPAQAQSRGERAGSIAARLWQALLEAFPAISLKTSLGAASSTAPDPGPGGADTDRGAELDPDGLATDGDRGAELDPNG